MNIRPRRRALAFVTLGLAAATPSVAQADALSEIRALKAQMRAQAERLRQLEGMVAKQAQETKEVKAQARHASNVANAAQAKAGERAPTPVFVAFKNGLFVETEDHAYSFKVGGRILIDGGGISQPLNGFDGQAGFRQARLEVEGKAANIWFYKAQYDFAGTGQNAGNNQTLGGVRDMFFGLQHPALTPPFAKDPAYIMVGSMFEPFSLEQVNSSKFRDFIERPMAVETFAPNRHLGLAMGAYGENWTAKGGIFTTSFEDASLNPARGVPATIGIARYTVPGGASTTNWWQATGGGQYFDITGRLTWAPIKDEHNLLHIGVSGRYHQPNDSTALSNDRVLALGNRIRSEATILGQGLLGTPDLSCGSLTLPVNSNVFSTSTFAGKCVRDVETIGLELFASHGPFSVQAEYIGSRYNRDGGRLQLAALTQATNPATGVIFGTPAALVPGGSTAYFDGYYVQGSWWLTGEEKASAYDVKDKAGASFNQLKIKNPLSAGGIGAWGLAARFSSVNLNSGPFQGSTLYNLLYATTFVAPNPMARAIVANAGINGGRQQNITVGLNWYPDIGVALQANWTRVMDIAAPLNGNPAQAFYSGAHPNLFEVRAKVYW